MRTAYAQSDKKFDVFVGGSQRITPDSFLDEVLNLDK